MNQKNPQNDTRKVFSGRQIDFEATVIGTVKKHLEGPYEVTGDSVFKEIGFDVFGIMILADALQDELGIGFDRSDFSSAVTVADAVRIVRDRHAQITREKMSRNMSQKLAILKSTGGYNPFYSVVNSALGERIIIEGKEYINLAANNYLGLANDERVKRAAKEAIDKYGTSLCGTPIAIGYSKIFSETEKQIAKFVGIDDCVLLPSGYQANNGVFLALADKNDVFIVDHYAHSSLFQGVQATGCTMVPFLHNNLEHLERILQKSDRYKKRYVVTESVFSTEGAIAPAKGMLALCEKHDAFLIIDDSHGIGVIGIHGGGILKAENIKSDRVIYTTSLGKAIANIGGVVGGSKALVDYLRYYFPHLIYSTAITPASIAGVSEVIDILYQEFDALNAKMWDYRNRIGVALEQAGFKIAASRTPINSIEAGSAMNTIGIAKKFFESNIITTPFVEPSVPAGQGRVRMIAGANLSDDTINMVVETIHKLWK